MDSDFFYFRLPASSSDKNSGCIAAEGLTHLNTYCKNRITNFSSPAGMSTKKILLGVKKIKLFFARESLVSDIPAGDGKIDNLFYSVGQKINSTPGMKLLLVFCTGISDCGAGK